MILYTSNIMWNLMSKLFRRCKQKNCWHDQLEWDEKVFFSNFHFYQETSYAILP